MNRWNRRKFISLIGGVGTLVTFGSCGKTPETKEEIFGKIEELLAASRWKAADLKTLEVMLKITNREKETFLLTHGRTFPCTDLQIIDGLWVKYSNGRFGWSVQEKIWESMGFKPGDYDYRNFWKLAERVGWRKKKNWIEYKNLNFSINAPEGHLPVRIIAEEWDLSLRNPKRTVFASVEVLWTDLTARIIKCNIK